MRTGTRPRPSTRAASCTIAIIGAITVITACSSTDSPKVVSYETIPESASRPDPTRTRRDSAEGPTADDHWHAAYSVTVCDEELAPFTDAYADAHGIHTHEDGIIHIHPFDRSVTGANANLDAFGDDIDATFGEESITLPDGEVLDASVECDGQPTKLIVAVGDADDLDSAPTIYTENFGDIRLDRDRMVISIALIPESQDPPVPWSLDVLDDLTDVQSS